MVKSWYIKRTWSLSVFLCMPFLFAVHEFTIHRLPSMFDVGYIYIKDDMLIYDCDFLSKAQSNVWHTIAR